MIVWSPLDTPTMFKRPALSDPFTWNSFSHQSRNFKVLSLSDSYFDLYCLLSFFFLVYILANITVYNISICFSFLLRSLRLIYNCLSLSFFFRFSFSLSRLRFFLSFFVHGKNNPLPEKSLRHRSNKWCPSVSFSHYLILIFLKCRSSKLCSYLFHRDFRNCAALK